VSGETRSNIYTLICHTILELDFSVVRSISAAGGAGDIFIVNANIITANRVANYGIVALNI
jgi:hypothetical protein